MCCLLSLVAFIVSFGTFFSVFFCIFSEKKRLFTKKLDITHVFYQKRTVMNSKSLIFQQNKKAIEQVLAQLVSEKYADTLRQLIEASLQNELLHYQNIALPTTSESLTLTLADELGRKTCEQAFQEKKMPNISDSIANDMVDIYLLRLGSERLITKYDALVRQIIYQFIQINSDLKPQEDDLFQDVNLHLLELLFSGKLDGFQGNSLFKTFLHTIIKRKIIRIVKNNKKVSSYQGFENEALLVEKPLNNYAETAIVQRHIKLYEAWLKSLKQKDNSQYQFCVKPLYALILEKYFVLLLYSNCNSFLLEEIITVFGEKNEDLTKEKILFFLSDFLAQLKEKPQNKAALKKWFYRKTYSFWHIMFEAMNEKQQNENDYQLNEQEINLKHKAIDQYFEYLLYLFYEKG